MKILIATMLAASAISSISLTARAQIEAQTVPQSAQATELTPAEQRIEAAKQQIAADPKKTQAYNELALAYLRRARETEDSKWNRKAESALAAGFKLDPKDFSLEKTQVALMLADLDFAHAEARAQELHEQTSDDVMVYGYLAEAEIGLGDWNAAVANTQWMMNLLPNNVPALMLAAKLRVHFGDPQGAIQLLNTAYGETSPTEVEEQAWIANQIAAIEIDEGKIDAANEILKQADETFPNYPYTRENMQRARKQAGSTAVATAMAAIATQPESAPATKPNRVEAETTTSPIHKSTLHIAFAPVPAELLTPRPSETERLIAKAQSTAARNGKDAKAWTALGAAYFQHARETGDVSDFELAEQALKKSLDLEPNGFAAGGALQSLAEVCMGEHRFTDALDYAQKALATGSGDLSPFAIVGDAYADMGEYNRARSAYEKLTPRSVEISAREAYARDSRMAYLSFVEGDTGAAIETMKTAVAEGAEAGIPGENLAWLNYELGEFETRAGDAEAADAAYRAALKTHPGDYRALAGLAKLLANHGETRQAIQLYEKAIAVVPMPTFIAELGDLYEKAGDHEQAKKQYGLVEYIGLLGHINQVLHNRDLALFYADHDAKLDEALKLAQKEFEVRHDIYTWDALAWALYKNGQIKDAAHASGEALKFGTNDALLHFHAGMIAARAGDRDRARKELTAAVDANPQFHLIYASEAQQALAQLDGARQESMVNDAR